MLGGFADFHALVPGFFSLTLAGILLGLAYQRTGNLYFSIGLHAGWIFWLKTYGAFTTSAPHAATWFWGTGKMIDGWLALVCARRHAGRFQIPAPQTSARTVCDFAMTALAEPFQKWFNVGLGFFYPEICQLCETERATARDGFVCARCWSQVRFIRPPFCERCGLPFAGDITTPFECTNCREMELHFTFRALGGRRPRRRAGGDSPLQIPARSCGLNIFSPACFCAKRCPRCAAKTGISSCPSRCIR